MRSCGACGCVDWGCEVVILWGVGGPGSIIPSHSQEVRCRKVIKARIKLHKDRVWVVFCLVSDSILSK